MSSNKDFLKLLARKDIPDDVKEIINTGFQSYQESLKRMEKSENLYRSLVENSREIIFTTDLEGKITSVNPAAERLTGWSIDEWMNTPFSPKIHPDDLDFVVKGFFQIIPNFYLIILKI